MKGRGREVEKQGFRLVFQEYKTSFLAVKKRMDLTVRSEEPATRADI